MPGTFSAGMSDGCAPFTCVERPDGFRYQVAVCQAPPAYCI